MNVLPCFRSWYEEHVLAPQRWAREQREAAASASAKLPKVRTDCSSDELAAIAAIAPGRVNYCPATGTKRFAGQIQGATQLTDAQRKYLWQVVYRFRRQIGDPRLVKIVEAEIAKTGGGA